MVDRKLVPVDAAGDLGPDVCKCGQKMEYVNRSSAPALWGDDYYWQCPLRRWSNFWQHSAAVKCREAK